MKNFFLMACVIIMSCVGCAKEEKGCTPVSPEAEDVKMKAYAIANGITAVKHSSGLYYEVMDSGTGVTPTKNSNVTATYVGKFLDNKIFDQGTADFPLSGVIEGWTIGIPLIKKGGKIRLIIPSALAYGCTGRPGIGPNEVLYFDVTLVDVK